MLEPPGRTARKSPLPQASNDSLPAPIINGPCGVPEELGPPASATPDASFGAPYSQGVEQAADSTAGDFPRLPPDPDVTATDLPPLDEELYLHGGSYLYRPEGDRLGWPAPGEPSHHDLLRLPENHQAPEPWTMFADFLGADPIRVNPNLHWPGRDGYVLEPRLVGYGRYDMFAATTKQGRLRRSLIGHNLIGDLDFRLTGTERFHAQCRPLGEGGTGGSYFSLNQPHGYVNNSAIEPSRYWFEGALDSMLGGWIDPFAALDYNFVVGKFPFQLHNSLLIDDEIQGVVLAKNTIYWGHLSNLNLQAFYGFNDVDTLGGDSQLIGGHAQAERRNVFVELTCAWTDHDVTATRDAFYAAASATWSRGPWTLTGRGLFKWQDRAVAGTGDGELFVAEVNRAKYFDHDVLGVDHAVFFFNGFSASRGWSSIAGANLNRIRTAFEVNPLVGIARGGPQLQDTVGAALGVQWFRHHDDESIVTETAFESPGGQTVWGAGIRYLRKTSQRSFLEVLVFGNTSSDDLYDRAGVYGAHSILF